MGMDFDEAPFIRRRQHAELVHALEQPDVRGVLLLGEAASGKTVLLRMVEREWNAQGRSAFYVSASGLSDPGELGDRILQALQASQFSIDMRRTIRSSAGAPPLRAAGELLREAGRTMPSPVLLLDALDESPYPLRVEAAVEELTAQLDNWKVVVASRPRGIARIGRPAQFRPIRLGELDEEERKRFIEAYGPPLSESALREAAGLAGGNPLLLRLLASELALTSSVKSAADFSPTATLERLIARAIDASPEQARLTTLLEQLALAGGRESIASLAERSHISEGEARRLLEPSGFVLLRDADGTVAILHDLVRDLILSRRILADHFRLADLEFGSEEAERDDLLDRSYVRRPSLTRILSQRRSIIVGDRGSGKSAIFRKLAARDPGTAERLGLIVRPVSNPADLLHRVVASEANLDAESLRAAWLAIVASVVASTVPASAPKQLQNAATDLQAAFGAPAKTQNRAARLIRAAVRPFAGTTLKLAVGPVNLEAKLPVGTGTAGGATVDIENFLRDADEFLRASAVRVVVMFDRIDETFKYDRIRQEALVQALLQAEARVSRLSSVGLVVFLRTDLFELYDIQEKTKVVSRMMTLEWSDEEWLQLLVNRVLVNRSLQRLAETVNATCGGVEVRRALEALFPDEIEGRPVEQWLIDSVRNGNGDVSPRLAVLLLHLARDLSPDPEALMSTLPVFSVDALRQAMTKLSDLSYSEVVNDFKIATTFVQNCRVGKLDTFALAEVEDLFDREEGTISEQVGLLERLGFLERVVVQDDSGTRSLFRIPRLYTRCWDYA
jgi:NACHT domain